MAEISSISVIDQKMAEMRIKNLEILKRHQEIEEDRQLAQQSGATTITKTVESTMRGTIKNRERQITNQQNFQENQHERMHRPPPVRRKFENDRNDTQRVQRVDYNRLKRERAQEITNQQYNNNNINPELLEYAYPFHYQSENSHDAEEPAHAKKLVIVNNQATRIGSGRFNQQQRTQEQGQRRREERMRRSGTNHNGHPGGPSEFHLDIPQIPIWHNSSMQPPIHVQLLPSNINGHHTGIDHLMNNGGGGGDQVDQSAFMHNFVYPTSGQPTAFNGNGTVYFAHPPPPMSNGPPPPSSSSSSQPTHFHQYHPTRTFENSNRHQFHHPSHFQSSSVFQPPPSAQLSTSSTSHVQQQQQEEPSIDLPPRFRRPPKSDHENRYSQQRPMSGDFDRFHPSSSRFNQERRFQARPQSFYDFSSHQPSNNRYQRNNNNNNNNLPLSAYMNTDDSSYENENINKNNYWGTSYQRRRTNPQRTCHQDKHQFPLSSYDPRQYGFHNNYQRRNDLSNRTNSNRWNTKNNNQLDQSNDIDLIEEWWEDDNTELIGTNRSTVNNDSQVTTTTVDDSGNSSLSTSMHLKESTIDDEDNNNTSANDFISPPSDVSTTDSQIIESLDQLQQQLKLEEALEKELESEDDLLLLTKEPTTYDTAHFLQWAKEKFREELAGRLTAQEIEQHDAVATDDDDDDDDDLLVNTDVHLEKFHLDQTTDEENLENVDDLKDDLNEKLKLEENVNQSTVVE